MNYLLTPTDIRQAFLQLVNEDLLKLEEKVDAGMQKLAQAESTLVANVQSNSILPYHYVKFIQALYSLGFIIRETNEFIDKMQQIISEVQKYVTRTRRFNLKNEQSAKELGYIACTCEKIIHNFMEIQSEVNDCMLRLAAQCAKNPDFKKLLHESLSQEDNATELFEWCIPYLKYASAIGQPSISLMDTLLAAIASLPPTPTSSITQRP